MKTKEQIKENMELIKKAEKDAKATSVEDMESYMYGAYNALEWILDNDKDIDFVNYTITKDKNIREILDNIMEISRLANK